MRFGETRSSFEEATMVYPAPTQDKKTIANDLSKKISGAAIEVHPILKPGLLESAYE